MKRDFNMLADGPFDVLIVGGGIYGAWTAYDSALRGLRVAVVDKGDWASGTSSASTKLIHGGLRYLEHLRFDLVHTSLDERKQLSRLMPHRVIPLRFFMPMYPDNRVGPLRLKTGLWLYDLMAGKGQPVPAHATVSRKETAARYPFLDSEHLKGGYTYGDCQTDDVRMTLDVIDGAQRAGAVAVNYAAVTDLTYDPDGRVNGATIEDRLQRETRTVDARVVVNTAGPWVPLVGRGRVLHRFVRYSKGVHLVMPGLPVSDALLMMTEHDQRILFVVPWYGRSLLGTTDSPYQGRPEDVRVSAEEVDYLLSEANRYFGDVRWVREDVLGCFAGLRALKNEPGKPLASVSREWQMIEPEEGYLVSIGGKYTSARADAAKMVDRIGQMLGRDDIDVPPTALIPPPSTPAGDFREWRKVMVRRCIETGIDRDTADWLIFRFGTGVDAIVRIIREDPDLARRIVDDLPFCMAEAVHCAREEMVTHLEDLMRRRIPITILTRPDAQLATRMARQVAADLGWGEADISREVTRVMDRWEHG